MTLSSESAVHTSYSSCLITTHQTPDTLYRRYLVASYGSNIALNSVFQFPLARKLQWTQVLKAHYYEVAQEEVYQRFFQQNHHEWRVLLNLFMIEHDPLHKHKNYRPGDDGTLLVLLLMVTASASVICQSHPLSSNFIPFHALSSILSSFIHFIQFHPF